MMVNRLWILLGKLLFRTAWPGLFLYLMFTRRTRVIVACGNEILVVKGWLGSGKWLLPGGGLHLREDAQTGACREVLEETGVRLEPARLKELYAGRMRSEGHRFFVHVFVTVLADRPEVSRQKYELTGLAWLPWRQLIDNPAASTDTKRVLALWRKV